MKSDYILRLFAASCLIVTFFSSNPAFAQVDDRTYSTLNIGFSVVSNTNRNVFHDFWKPETGVEVFMQTPFHAFDAEFGWHYLSYEGKGEDSPDFDSTIFYLQLEKTIISHKNIDVYTGVRVAMYRMNFEENEVVRTPGLLSEQELASGLQAGISAPFMKGLKLEFSTTYLKIFTKKRMNLVFFEAGISREFKTPTWLKDFLR